MKLIQIQPEMCVNERECNSGPFQKSPHDSPVLASLRSESFYWKNAVYALYTLFTLFTKQCTSSGLFLAFCPRFVSQRDNALPLIMKSISGTPMNSGNKNVCHGRTMRSLPHLSQENAAVLVVGTALMADTIIYYLLVPLLPGYAEKFNLSPMGVGLLVWSYSGTLLVSTLPVGRMLAGQSRRWPMLCGLLILALSTAVFALGNSYSLLVAARILQGISATLTWVAGMAFLADCTPPERRGRSMGLVFAFANFGLLLGPPLSGWLYQTIHPRAPFVMAIALVLMDAAMRVFLLKDPPKHSDSALGSHSIHRDPTIRVLAGALAMGAMGTTVLETVLPVHYSTAYGFKAAAIGMLFGFFAVAHMLSSPWIGALSDKVGRKKVMQAGFMATALLLGTILQAQSPLSIGLAMVAAGLTASLVLSPISPALTDRVDEMRCADYTAAFGLSNFSFAAGMTFGPMLGTALQSLLGLKWAMTILGGAFLLYLPLLNRVKNCLYRKIP